jgi:two-component system OmpR family response regulator
MRILIIEDEARVADFLDRGLRAEGHFSVRADDGPEGLSLALDGDFDIILLDLMLPTVHGLDVCQKLRMEGNTTPVMMLTALDGTENIVRGLRLGADEYMTKPFSFEELLARVEALGRRGSAMATEQTLLTAGGVEFDRTSLRVSVSGEVVHMTAKELAILELLMSHPDTLFSRERILSNVWGLHHDPMTNVVDVYIGRLRRKIDPADGPSLIETVHGLGYRISDTPADNV